MPFKEIKASCPHCGQDLPDAKLVAVEVTYIQRIPLADVRSICERFRGQKIEAIKELRGTYPGLSLREAKELAETYGRM